MQDFHSRLTEKLQQDRQEFDQHCQDITTNIQSAREDLRNLSSDWKQLEANVLNITKVIFVPKLLEMKKLLDKHQKYRMRLEQQFTKTLAEKQTVDIELILYQTKTEMQYQDLMSFLLNQQQALTQFQSETMAILHQILQNKDHHQQCNSELKSNMLQMMELLKRMNHRFQNQDLNLDKLKTQIKDQQVEITAPMEKMQQQLHKIIWGLGILGAFNILLFVKKFI